MTHILNKCRIFILVMLAGTHLVFAQAGKPLDDTTQHIVPGRQNSKIQAQKPYVILISADGFRYDYAEKYNATHIKALGNNGVRAASMIPSYPSLTFPNHYTMVTGLYPAHHGLVNNTFYDRARDDKYAMSAKEKVSDGSWYGGTPLWVLAEQQQMISACFFWVGSEADIKGTRPTYYYKYTEQMPASQRIQIVKNWLSLPEEKRPHLITFYLSEPDHSGHKFGPGAPETEKAVKMVDSVIYQLTEAVKTTGLPVNFVFVSDHGMTAVDQANPIAIPGEIDQSKFIIPSSGTIVDLIAKNKEDIMPAYTALKKAQKDYKVYLKAEIPAKLHYSAADDRFNRIGDIVLMPEWPKVFFKGKPGIGYHGYDPSVVKEMHATFMAWGPAFKAHLKIPSFENVNVYPMVTEVLGLTYTEAIDGKKEVLERILK